MTKEKFYGTLGYGAYKSDWFNLKYAMQHKFKPKADEEPTKLWTSNFHNILQDFWHRSQLEPASDAEVEAYFEQLRLEKNARARAYYKHKKKLKEE
jgi:hypothetical protein